jgi:hypothetical protein
MKHLIIEGITKVSDEGTFSILLRQQGQHPNSLCLTIGQVEVTVQKWDRQSLEPIMMKEKEKKVFLNGVLSQLKASQPSEKIYFWKQKKRKGYDQAKKVLYV